jgi:hypothetical protein
VSEEWGPWIEHDGKGCPCVGQYVQYVIGKCKDGSDPSFDIHFPGPHEKRVGKCVYEGIAINDGGWCWGPHSYPNIRYRVRKPRGLTILESLLADLPEKVDA